MRRSIKKALSISIAVTFFLVLVLGIHIYWVTQPKIDENTIAMARFDIKQDISAGNAQSVSEWLYQQPGVNHVLCNADADNVVFTFYPLKTDANRLVKQFNAKFGYNASRYLPGKEDMKKGCPVSANSASYRLAYFFKHT